MTPRAILIALAIFASWLFGRRSGALEKMFEEIGVAVTVAILLFLAIHWLIFRLYAALVRAVRQLADDREREIERLSQINDRLIAENSEYHDRFLRIIDKISDKEDNRK